MKTLLEKWNHYKSIIDAREQKYIETTIADVPKYLYQLYPNGTIRELEITKVYYANRQYFHFDKKPTKKDVEKIKQFSELEQVFVDENILYNYTEIYKTRGSCRGAFSLKDIGKYTTKEVAEAKSVDIISKLQSEELLIKNLTHKRCERCGKLAEASSVVHYKIISIATYGYAGRNGIFCSNTCASNEQMAHEG